MELIFNLITLIKEINEHINDYKCDDEMIESVLRKIINIDPHLRGMTLNIEDPNINANCQSLFRIITKIKVHIKEYQSSYKFTKFRKIKDLKRNIENFDKELNDIFKNLKINILIDNTKIINDLKYQIENDVCIQKEILSIKKNNIQIRKDSNHEIVNISEKIKNLQNSFENTTIVKFSDISSIYDNIYDFDKKYHKLINDMNVNIVKLENNMVNIRSKIDIYKILKGITDRIDSQEIAIKYNSSFLNYFQIFMIEQFFYYFFVIVFYFFTKIFLTEETKVYT